MIVLEWDYERRGKLESIKEWDNLIEHMGNIEDTSMTDTDKIATLMGVLSGFILLPVNTYPRNWIIQNAKLTRDKIEYYKYNPEEE
jgi:hypothetical protein